MKIAIICVGVVTMRFRTVPPHGSSNKTRVNRAMPHQSVVSKKFMISPNVLGINMFMRVYTCISCYILVPRLSIWAWFLIYVLLHLIVEHMSLYTF